MTMAQEKSVTEVLEERGREAAGILTGYHAAIDEIGRRQELKGGQGTYAEHLDFQQRGAALQEEKAAAVEEVRARAIKKYLALMERHNAQITRRRQDVEQRLFDVDGPSDALARASLAPPEELKSMLAVAARAGSEDLARAVFVAAHERNLGEVVADYFEKADPASRGLYEEWRQIPSAEVLERQVSGAETLFGRPDADTLTAAPAY